MEEMDRGMRFAARFSIIINGSPRGSIPAHRGIRQGDPLSPFLFVIVAKAVSRMIMAVASEDLISGFKVCDSIPPTSLLHFADDTLIFCAANEDRIQNVKATLLCFEAMSGLKINFFKSELIGIRVGEALLTHYVDILGCKVGHLPSYFPLPRLD
eukprot:TRINITY_DN38524_c0_g1_i1.p1 TRINITY_DN38524_c0_g1~~TRINITY_DN38524_c0_g1_i1.p1  ORF type:complete len:155 (+),score=21.32 TRINITY_DN38524_c0_g1_i1:451-915(+)